MNLRRPSLPGRQPADLLVVPVAAAVGILILLLATKDGGFDVTIWLPVALFVTVLLGLALWFRPVKLASFERAAVAAFAALTVWTAASIGWAEVRGDALTGADRTLFYFSLFTLFVVLPWRPQTAWFFSGFFSAGVTVITLWQFLRVAHAPVGLHNLFIIGRLATPISYPNADCALLLMAALPALIFASRREVPLLARGVLLAVAGVATELAIACQSRMSLLALPLVLVLLIAGVGGRVRLLAFSAPLVLAVLLSTRTILHLYDAVLTAPGATALHHARSAILWSAVSLLVVGWLLAALDNRLTLSFRVRRAIAVAVCALAVLGVVGALVEAHRLAPHPVRSLHAQWTSFVHGDGYSAEATSHFISTGTNRYDIWRVAAHEFTSAPVVGVGADNFAIDYLRERRSNAENPLYPHSLLLRVVAQTGIVGGLVFVAFLAAALAAAWRRFGRNDAASVTVVACLTPFLYFFVHGAVDWFWEIPALGAPAFAFLAIAVRLGVGNRVDVKAVQLPHSAVGVAAVVAVVALGAPWLAARETTVAGKDWVQDRKLAYDRLSLAARLNPLSDLPAETEGLIAARSNDLARARAAFGRALDRNPNNWYSHLELAVVDSETGRLAAARGELAAAQDLNPKELVLAAAAARLRKGLPVTQTKVDAIIAAQDRASGGAR